MTRERTIVTIGHSYVVAENRRLAHEMALARAGRWRVLAIAPAAYPGDLRRIPVEPVDAEASALVPLPVRFASRVHLMSYRGLADALSSAKPDLVHCWEEPYVHAAAQVARHAPPSAHVVYATFQNISKRYPWPLSRFERRSLSRASGWIAFGRTVEDALVPRAPYARLPHAVIPPGVDVGRFRPDPDAGARTRRLLGWPDGDPVVGYLGRFAPQKGLADLCDALERMRARWRALFVGGGELQPDLARFAASHPGRVHVATGVVHGDVPRWINAMTVLAAPSRTTATWREQFGRMLIEAMACGVPVVASDSGEMPHVVDAAAAVVRERDPRALADALDALLEDPGARARQSAAGLERARTKFAWPVVARQHLTFFDRLLESGERR